MKALLQHAASFKTLSFAAACMAVLLLFAGCQQDPHVPTLHITTAAAGLMSPMGLETDKAGNIWVAETGTAANDGKVVVITPGGSTFDAIVNLSSIHNKLSGEVEGPAHLLLDKGMLYVLAGNYLYTADVSHFTPGDAALDAVNIPYEDIGSFVLSYPFIHNAYDTHPYNLTKGPEGDLYIADAGANAIIHRKGKGNYTVLAEVPGIPNTTGIGSPEIESVPTGIIYDGQNFLVTTLLGFPFPGGQALIYKISTSGAVSVYQDGFTSLVDLAQGNYLGRLALQYATFGETGFAANSGALVWANGAFIHPFKGGFNLPVGIKQYNANTWYITCMGDGTVLKVALY